MALTPKTGPRPRRNEEQLRRALVSTAQQMLRLGLVSGTAGNLSARVDDEQVLLTPSALPYPDLQPEDLVLVNLDGEVLAARAGRRPTSELALHLTCMRTLPEVEAVVHSHALHASMFALAQVPIPCDLEEMALYLGGEVAVAEYRMTGTQDLAEVAASHLRERSAVLLANHGLLSVGNDLEQAFELTCLVDRCAQIVLGARQLGGERPLPARSRDQLVSVYREKRHASLRG